MKVQATRFSIFGDILYVQCDTGYPSQTIRFLCPLANFSHALALTFLDVPAGNYVCSSLSGYPICVESEEGPLQFIPVSVWRPRFAGGFDFLPPAELLCRAGSIFREFYHPTRGATIGTYTDFTLDLIKKMRAIPFPFHLRALDEAIVHNGPVHGGLASQVLVRSRLRYYEDCVVPGPRVIIDTRERAFTCLRLDYLLGPLDPKSNLIIHAKQKGGF